jgi:hypothetical protein
MLRLQENLGHYVTSRRERGGAQIGYTIVADTLMTRARQGAGYEPKQSIVDDEMEQRILEESIKLLEAELQKLQQINDLQAELDIVRVACKDCYWQAAAVPLEEKQLPPKKLKIDFNVL